MFVLLYKVRSCTVWCKGQRRGESKRLSYFPHSTIWVSSEALKQTHIFIFRNCRKFIKCIKACPSVGNVTYPKWDKCNLPGWGLHRFLTFLIWLRVYLYCVLFWVIEYASWEGIEPRKKRHINYLTLLVLGVLLDYGQHLSKSVAIINWKGIHKHQWLILM